MICNKGTLPLNSKIRVLWVWYRHVGEFVMTLKHLPCPIICVINKAKEDVVFATVIFLHRIVSVHAVKLNSEQSLRTRHFGIRCESISWNTCPVKVNGKGIQG